MPSALHWCFASFRLDPTTTCLWRDGQLVPLPPKAFAVLAYLVAHAGEVVPKETLLEAVWPETVVSEGVLKTYMSHIRQALGETARTPQYIATVHHRGYRFVAPVTVRVPVAPGHPPSGITRRNCIGCTASCSSTRRRGNCLPPPLLQSRSLFPTGYHAGSPAGGQNVGTAGDNELVPPVAAARENHRRLPPPCRDLPLVHRRF